MKCQQCGINRASINIAMQLNNERKQMRVCSDCFQKIQNQLTDSSNFFQGGDMFSNPFFQSSVGGQGQSRTTTHSQHGGRGGLLDELGTNVTDEARNGKIDPVIGRDNEIKRVIETLNRRNKNNPVLIGEPGVGKTAI